MSDTHARHDRWIIRRAITPPGYSLFHVIDTDTDLSYGCFCHDSARRIADRLNAQEGD